MRLNLNKKGISPLIATILLVVVAVVLIAIVLSWGKIFTTDSLSSSSKIKYDESDLTGKIYVKDVTENHFLKKDDRVKLVLETPLDDSSNIYITSYKILGDNPKKYPFINTKIDLNNPILLGKTIPLDIVCLPEDNTKIQLYTDRNTFLSINVSSKQLGITSCDIYGDYADSFSVGIEQSCALVKSNRAKCFGWGRNPIIGDGIENKSVSIPEEVPLLDVIKVGSGDEYNCALLKNKDLYCWGDNSYGKIGTGDDIDVLTPYKSLSDVKDFACGDEHTCAILENGTIKCFGYNAHGELGNDSTTSSNVPVDVVGINNAKSIYSFLYTTCAILEDGTTKCWGYNAHGEFGNGTTGNSYIPVDGPTFSSEIIDFELGSYHGCALLEDGSVKCWGRNNYGQLGDDSTTQHISPIDVNISLTKDVIQVSTGQYHTCALLDDRTVKCFGNNSYGQFGDGTFDNSLVAVESNISNVKYIQAGLNRTFFILNTGESRAAGDDRDAQLGTGIMGESRVPVIVEGINNITDFDLASWNGCALYDQNNVKCWAGNDSYLIDFNNFSNVKSIHSGWNTVYLLFNDDTVKTWGYNSYGQLGDGTTSHRYTPIDVNISNVEDIYAFYWTVCAILNDGSLKCWGRNNYGQVGDGTTTNQANPVLVSGVNNVIDVGINVYHTCVVQSDGTVKCFGWNEYGQLGNGTTTNSSTPVEVIGIDNALRVEVGYNHSCAFLDDGTVKCWGSNESGLLGTGSTDTNSSIPVLVNDLNNVVDIASAGFSMYALLDDGSLKSWGWNGYGILGYKTTDISPIEFCPISKTPKEVKFKIFEDVSIVSLNPGYKHMCILTSDDLVRCWGYNFNHILGDSEETIYNIPKRVLLPNLN